MRKKDKRGYQQELDYLIYQGKPCIGAKVGKLTVDEKDVARVNFRNVAGDKYFLTLINQESEWLVSGVYQQ